MIGKLCWVFYTNINRNMVGGEEITGLKSSSQAKSGEGFGIVRKALNWKVDILQRLSEAF